MSMSDPIADSLTRLRNASMAGHEEVNINVNKMMESILGILKSEGFIQNISPYQEKAAKKAKVELKYYEGKPVLRGIDKVSKPGRRVYLPWKEIRPTLNNVGISILSTPQGVMSGKDAKYRHIGGEFICKVW